MPYSDGGSAITGYTLQWKAAAGSWDVPADVSSATITTGTAPYHHRGGLRRTLCGARPGHQRYRGWRALARGYRGAAGAADRRRRARPDGHRGPDRHHLRDGRRPGRRPSDLPVDPRPSRPGHRPGQPDSPVPPPSPPRRVHANTTITFTLTVTDQHNATAADHLAIAITHLNAPPTVQAGPRPDRLQGADRRPGRDGRRPGRRPSGLPVGRTTPRWPSAWTTPATLSPSFTAPEVGSDTTITLTLSVHDGAASASDSLNVTIIYVNTTTVWTPDQPPRPLRHRQDNPGQRDPGDNPGHLGGARPGAGQIPDILGQGGRTLQELYGPVGQRLPHRALPYHHEPG